MLMHPETLSGVMILDHQAVLAPRCSQKYGKKSRIGLSKGAILQTKDKC